MRRGGEEKRSAGRRVGRLVYGVAVLLVALLLIVILLRFLERLDASTLEEPRSAATETASVSWMPYRTGSAGRR